jgi:hypothetical protein
MAKRAEPEQGAAAAAKQARRAAAPVTAATPWGPATVVEEVRVSQRAGGKHFSSILQLLENARGEPLVRIAYATEGVARRGPVTLRPRDVERLRASLATGSALAATLGWTQKPKPDEVERPHKEDSSGGEA